MKKTLVTGALITSAVLGALFAGNAMAADMPVKAPHMQVMPPAFSWTGCYIDGGVGYGMWNQDHSVTAELRSTGVPNTFRSTDVTNGGRGWLGRAGAGCDIQLSGPLSSWVVGVFGDYDWTNLKGSLSTQLSTVGGDPLQGDEKQSSAWAVGGRIGYVVAPMVLTYVDGGWTETHFDQISEQTALGGSITSAFPAHTYQGWFIGSGVEYAFTWLPINGLFVRTEYRYSTFQRDDLTQFNVNTGLPAGNGGLGAVLHSQKQVQTITTSLVWRFNFFH
jgi:outer membrane immunogenic protein